MWRSSLLSNKENVVQKSGGAEPLPKLSLDLSLTRPAVLVNSQLRMLVLDLLQYFVTLVRKSAALDHLSMNWEGPATVAETDRTGSHLRARCPP